MKRVLLLFRLIPFALCHCLGMQESPSPRPDSLFAVDSLRIFDDSQDSAYKRDNIEILVEQLQDADELSIFDIMEQWLPLTNTSFETRSRFSQKLQPARGFTEGKYLGTSFKSYQRMKVRRGENFAAAFLMEKDAGESRLNDFFSGYVQIKNTVPSSSIVLGDYVVEAGQGISMWRGFDYRKGADVIVPVLKRNREVVPYASSDENAFLRGIATTVDFSDFSLMAFYSRKSLSALLDPDGNVTSLYTTGYFRTENEREKRENLTETLLGTRGKYHLPNGDAFGATVFAARYSRNFSLTDERFNGNTLSVFSADYLFSIRTIKFFGEWAISHNVAGGISGIHLEPDHSIDLITAYRQYPVEFFDHYSHGFAERSGTNERGWYLGVHIRPVRHVRFAGYFDQFTFPSPTQDMIFPGEGHEIFFQADVSQIRRVLMTPRYRRKVTMESHTVSDPSGRAMRIDEKKVLQSFRLTIDCQLQSKTQLRTRMEYVDLEVYPDLSKSKEHGLMLYQDVVSEIGTGLTFNARLAIFRTDSFDSGIGEYEQDLPGTLTVPVLYGQGVRWYLLANYSLFESLHLSLKYVELIRDDVKTIGSGLDELPGNRDNRISIQFDFNL